LVPFAPVTAGISFVFTFDMHCISTEFIFLCCLCNWPYGYYGST